MGKVIFGAVVSIITIIFCFLVALYGGSTLEQQTQTTEQTDFCTTQNSTP